MQRVYAKRRDLVVSFLEANPACQRCQSAWSTEVHEVKTRARGGSILDETNLRALCDDCHRWVTGHPREAQLAGWMKNSWEVA